MGSRCSSYCPRCSCGSEQVPFLCLDRDALWRAAQWQRHRSQLAAQGGVTPSTLTPPPAAREGARGGEQLAGGAPRGQSWRRPRALSAARGSQRPRPAVRARRARRACPAMAAAAFPPWPLPLLRLPPPPPLLLLLLFLRADPVRAESKVFPPGRRSPGSQARGGAVAGRRVCAKEGA